MTKFRLMVSCPNPKDATSFYRGIGPLSQLHKNFDGLELTFCSEHNWSTMALCDGIFMQRPYTNDQLGIIKMAKDNNKPVWVDYDDDLFNVPYSNPAYGVYSREDVKLTIAKCISHADVVTVSTPFLKRQLQQGEAPLNRNIYVIPNAFNDYLLLGRRTAPPKQRAPLIMWRGSPTHHKDLSDYGAQIINLANSNPKWTFHFQGDKPWFIYEKLNDNSIFSPPIDPIQYFSAINQMKPQAMMVPLSDNVFNKSKSNIAWIEAVYAGAVAIAPDWEEWNRPGCITFNSPAEFETIVTELIEGRIAVNDLVHSGWEFIMENLRLSRVNELRAEVVGMMRG